MFSKAARTVAAFCRLRILTGSPAGAPEFVFSFFFLLRTFKFELQSKLKDFFMRACYFRLLPTCHTPCQCSCSQRPPMKCTSADFAVSVKRLKAR